MRSFSFLELRYPVSYCSAILCAVTYVNFTLLAYAFYPFPLSPFKNWLSDLGDSIVNPEGAIFYNVGVFLSAIFSLSGSQLGCPHGR